MARTRNVTAFPLPVRTDVEYLQFAARIFYIVHTHLHDLREWVTGIVPCLHSTDEVTREFGKTGANKQSHDLIEIIIIFQHEQNRLFWIKKRPSPDRKHGRPSNVQRSTNMRGAKTQHQTRINENACFFFDCFLKWLWRQTSNSG